MDREWFILMNGKREGPYTPFELQLDRRITPDTLVWKKGFKDWIAIRYVAELKEIFKDKLESKPGQKESELSSLPSRLSEQEALTIQQDPSQFFLWLIVLMLIIIYIFYQFNKNL